MTITARWKSWAPYLLSVARIMLAFDFFLHGTSKLFAWPNPLMPQMPTVHLMSQLGLAGILECFGGGLLMLGLFTRPVAFLLSGEMAVGYFQGHAPHGFFPTVNQGELAVAYCFFWLYLSAAGAGPISLDALLRKRAA